MVTYDAPIVGRLLDRLRNVTDAGQGAWTALCPNHDDQRNSLSIGIGDDGRLLIHCHAGCDSNDIVRAAGLKMTDLFPASNNGHARNGKPQGRIVQTYDYRDETGNVLFQVCRMEPKDFRQRKPDGNGGWTWNTKGVRRVLYRLPELLAADPGQPVFVVEGEKDVDRLTTLGLVATTNPNGAGKWRKDFSEFLRQRRVIVLPDNDEPGRKHASNVARSVLRVAASVKVVELPGLPDKGDVSDFLNAGGTVEDLLRLVDAAPEWKPTDKPKRVESSTASDSKAAYKLTDYGNAERLRDRFGAEIRYCHPFAKWLCWDGRRWAEDQTGRVKQLAKQTVRAMWAEVENLDGKDDRRAFSEHVQRSESAARINALIELARDEVPILPANLDNEPWLLNCLNGTLDLRTGKLREHRREDFITKLCPVTFDPTVDCPTWLKFLTGIFEGRQSLIDYLRRLVGYCLTGHVSEQILPILYGVGANGKSTFLNIVLKMLGTDYAMQGIPDLLMAKRNESHPTERADLFGKRFVSCVETEDGRALAESLVKQLTGGENIRARRMREDFWQFNPTHKLFLCTNHKPRIRGTDHAIWRRIRLIPFSVKFWNPDKGESGPAELRQDKRLPEKLESELPGILAWAVQGCLEWQAHGLGMPDEVNAATAAYQIEQDVLGEWLADCCLTGTSLYKAKSSDLYADYRRWCEAHGEHPINNRQFGSALSERGFERFTNNGTWYHGVGLLDNRTPDNGSHGTNGTNFPDNF